MTYTLTTIQTLALTVAIISLTAIPAAIIALHFPRLRKGAEQVLSLCKYGLIATGTALYIALIILFTILITR